MRKAELVVIRKVGTRGSLLLILGTIWVILGMGFLMFPMERFSRPGPGGPLDFLDEGPGVHIFSSMWILGGVIAFYTAFRRSRTCEDDLGFNGVALPPFLWSMGYWWSWIIHLVFDGEVGRANTYIAALIYSTLTVLIVFLSHHLQDHPEGPCARRRSIESR